MDDAREGFQLIDILIGIILLVALVGIVVVIYRSSITTGTSAIRKVETTSSEAPLVRLAELSMEQDPILCTGAASVIQDLDTLDLSYILITTSSGSTIYTYETLQINNPNGASIVRSVAPTDEAVQALLSHSSERCIVDYGTDDIDRYWVSILITG